MSRGGMFIPSQDTNKSYSTVLEYLANSEITKLTNGAYGLTYIAELNDTSVIRTPFLKLTVGKLYKTPVTKLLVKMCVIEDPYVVESSSPRNDITWNVARQMNIMPLPIEEITAEINVQTDIYLKTMQYLQPICPGIVYSKFIVRSDNGILDYFHEIPKNNTDPRTDDNANSKVGFGIIVMELASDYVTMFEYKRSNNANEFYDARIKCLFALIQLALDTGYTHGDHHFGNIMYNKKDSKYFHGTRGRILLIDFGRSTKIPSSPMEQFKTLCKSNQYLQALELLCLNPTANYYVANPKNAERFYGWACGSYGDQTKTNKLYVASINEYIQKLFEQREEQLSLNVAIMEKLHKTKKNNIDYPLLPLSNRLKNQLYNGILPIDKPKNKTIRVTMRSKTKSKTIKRTRQTESTKSSHSNRSSH